jgi:glutathione S-transferase
MLSGFSALRHCMSANLRARAEKTPDAPGVGADIARIFDIWTASLESNGGPFLLGEFSIADCMYFPVASRFRTYGVELPELLARYSAALFRTPEVQELEQIAAGTPAIPEYDVSLHPR